ncbi:MAG: hypothetical protein QNK04_00460 [Myxococcota bacterium]|nr:hypothetical protein [Myxococcota bacterium]
MAGVESEAPFGETVAYKHELLKKLERLSRERFDEFDEMRQLYASHSPEQILDYCHRRLRLIDAEEYRNIRSSWMRHLSYVVGRFGEALALVGRHAPRLNCWILHGCAQGPPRISITHDDYTVDVLILAGDTTVMKGAMSPEADALRRLRTRLDYMLAEMERNDRGY